VAVVVLGIARTVTLTLPAVLVVVSLEEQQRVLRAEGGALKTLEAPLPPMSVNTGLKLEVPLQVVLAASAAVAVAVTLEVPVVNGRAAVCTLVAVVVRPILGDSGFPKARP